MLIRFKRAEDTNPLITLMMDMPEYFSTATLDYAREHMKGYLGFVALEENMFMGFIAFAVSSLDRQLAKLCFMAVRPETRRQGLGTALLGAMESELRCHGVKRVELVTLDENPRYPEYQATRFFYFRHGYVIKDRTADLDEPDVVLLMLEKQLS